MTRSMARDRWRAIVASLALALLLPLLAAMPALAARPGPTPQCAGPVLVGDVTAPTKPTGFELVSRSNSGSITLGWTASTDNAGVAGYRMYRDGVWQGTLCQAGVDLIGTVWYDKIGGRNKPPVRYELFAVDAAGNMSEPATLVITQ